MLRLVSNTVRLNSLILMLINVPLIVELAYVIRIWLGEIPAYVLEFCVFTLLFNQFSNIACGYQQGCHGGEGQDKRMGSPDKGVTRGLLFRCVQTLFE